MSRARLIGSILAVVASMLVAAPASAAPVGWAGTYPTTGTVIIPADQHVVLDTDLDLTGLHILGTVECGTSGVQLKARWILIGGTFRCGTEAEPFRKRLTITLKGDGNGSYNGYGDKYIVVTNGGTFELHGKQRKSWTRLAETAPAGATTIRLEDPVWKEGEQIVLAPTNYRMEQAETATIASRSGDLVTLRAPLEREHYCATDSYAGKKLRECAEVGLLSHNITVQGSAASTTSGIGGHFMALADTTVKIEDAEFRRMGQLGRPGRYPIHFHLAGDVAGSYVRRTSVHEAYNRWVTIHGTHNLVVRRVVGYDTVGHGFYLEDGIETGNVIADNLGILVRGAEPATALTPSDVDASTFWISNPDNVVNRNVAAGADFAGFWLAFPEHPVGLSTDLDIWPNRTPLRSFRKNVAHSIGFAGLYIDEGEDQDRNVVTTWYEPRLDPADPDSPHVTPTIFKLTTYKNRHFGAWIRTFSGIVIERSVFADNWRSLYLANIPTGPTDDNVGLITDSLLVGASSNKGQAEPWEIVDVNGHTVPKHWEPDAAITGVQYYDGPMRIENSVLARFRPNATRDAGALSGLFPNRFSISVRNEAENLTFRQSKAVLFPEPGEGRQGDAGTMFHDVDGSVTGTPGAEVVVDPSLLDDPSCITKPAWHASVCHYDEYVRVRVRRHDGKDIGADVTRSDGRRVYVRGAGTPDDAMSLNLRADVEHVLAFRAGTPDRYTFYTGEFTGSGATRLAVPAPPGNWTVTIWGVREPQRASLADLNSGPGGYFYDPATGLIHLRFTEEAGRGGVIEP